MTTTSNPAHAKMFPERSASKIVSMDQRIGQTSFQGKPLFGGNSAGSVRHTDKLLLHPVLQAIGDFHPTVRLKVIFKNRSQHTGHS